MRVSHAYNGQVSVVATGHAVDREGHTIYLGATGHKTSLKSIWATFAQGKTVRTSWQSWVKRGLKYGKPLVQPVSESPNYQQMIVLARGAHPKDEVQDGDYFYLLHLDPEGVQLSEYDDRRREIAQAALPELQTALARRLNAYLPIPVLDEWGEHLWQVQAEQPRYRRSIQSLHAYGDCLAAAAVLLSPTGWQEAISSGLREGRISF